VSRIRYSLAALVVAVLLAGCTTGQQVTLPPPGATPIPQRLFVANDGGSGVLDIFAPPFSGTSTPVVSFQDGTSTDIDDVAFDSSNRMYIGNFGQDKVDVFNPPFSASSTAAFSITTPGAPEGLDLDASGNLYVENGSVVSVFSAPLSGASTASATISTGLSGPIGVKFDALGNLYVADGTNNYVAIYNPPFTNSSAPAIKVPAAGVWGIGIDRPTGNLWAVERSAKTVVEFTPPFSNTSTPALTITTGLGDPLYPAIDHAGNLYVSDATGAPTGVRVYLAPLSNASAPAFTIPTSASLNGIRFGQ